MADPTPEQRSSAAKRRLVHLAGLSVRSQATERQILAASQDRLEAVQADLATLQPRVTVDRAAGDRYAALTVEKGQLETVIARALATLGEG